MTLQERISADMKEAMKAKDKVRLAALRDIKSKIMLALTETGGADYLDDAAVTKILSKQLKQREDTLAIYKEQGREDLFSYIPQSILNFDKKKSVQADNGRRPMTELTFTRQADEAYGKPKMQKYSSRASRA